MAKVSKPAKPAAEKNINFESALQRLEAIASQLEQGEAPLEKALELYEEGVVLARQCASQLAAAERKVEQLEDRNGRLIARPLDPSGEVNGAGQKESDEADSDFEEEELDEEDQDPDGRKPGQNSLF